MKEKVRALTGMKIWQKQKSPDIIYKTNKNNQNQITSIKTDGTLLKFEPKGNLHQYLHLLTIHDHREHLKHLIQMPCDLSKMALQQNYN